MGEVARDDAAIRLSELVDRVAAGEEIVITDEGRPIARLIPYESRHTPGAWRGRVIIHDGFDEIPEGFHDVVEPPGPGDGRRGSAATEA